MRANGVIARKLSLLDEVANELETLRPLDLTELGAISNRETYVRMAQMRNVIVRRYDQVDPQVLVKVVNNGLEQYRSDHARKRHRRRGADRTRARLGRAS